jgi:hypothetical protein
MRLATLLPERCELLGAPVASAHAFKSDFRLAEPGKRKKAQIQSTSEE